ncbi:MAG: CRISPR-associated endonuclease Cas1 [Thaumarchaeota archaeon]|nr:MAG: CRISPR-associated endonuclease Cas1 [Nitrososphaerota archaeon]
MNPLLLSGFGISITVDKRKLVINNKPKNEKLEFYPHKISHDGIVIDGHYGNVSFEALRWLSKHDISLSLLNWNGKLLSVTLPDTPKSGRLRVSQYQKYLDNDFRFKIAIKIINNKISNSLNLLKELSKFYDVVNVLNFKKTIHKEEQYFKNNLKDFKFKTSHDSLKYLKSLMTYEGRMAILYWSELEKIFKILKPEFNFKTRKSKESSRNYNASDEINSLLNYGYSILESEVRKAINSVGLDPSIGFLHEITQSRTPLVYDLQELFRWIVELSVIQLLEQNSLKKSDFVTTENYHTRLKENTASLLIDTMRFNFALKVPYKSGKNYLYSVILEDNVKQLANHILNKTTKFEIVIPKISLQRNDVVSLRNKIELMTPEQRKQLGINKSTLWYLKKNLKNNKSFKIYDKVLTKIQ